MLCVGNLNILGLFLEQRSSCGKKDIMLMQLKKKLSMMYPEFLIIMSMYTKICCQCQSSKTQKQKKKSLLVAILLQHLKHLFRPAIGLFKQLPHINWVCSNTFSSHPRTGGSMSR